MKANSANDLEKSGRAKSPEMEIIKAVIIAAKKESDIAAKRAGKRALLRGALELAKKDKVSLRILKQAYKGSNFFTDHVSSSQEPGSVSIGLQSGYFATGVNKTFDDMCKNIPNILRAFKVRLYPEGGAAKSEERFLESLKKESEREKKIKKIKELSDLIRSGHLQYFDEYNKLVLEGLSI